MTRLRSLKRAFIFRPEKRSSSAMLVWLVSMLLLAAGCHCGSRAVSTPRAKMAACGILRVRLAWEPRPLNPVFNSDIRAWRMFFPSVLEPLVDLEPGTGKVRGRLATSWSEKRMKGGRQVWGLELRRGVHWHDGRPLTAEDVKFTLDLAGGKRLHKWLVGCAMDGVGLLFDDVRIVDPLHVEVRLNKADPAFLARLAGFPVVSKHQLTECGGLGGCTRVLDHPIGTGPFQFVQWWPGKSVLLKKNADYWGPAASVDALEYRFMSSTAEAIAALKRGDVDVVAGWSSGEWLDLAPDLLHEPQGFRKVLARPHGMVLLVVYGPMESAGRPVRQAIGHLIDRQVLTQIFPWGAGPFISGPVSHDSAQQRQFRHAVSHDAALAHRLFEQAGWKMTLRGIRRLSGMDLTVTVLIPAGSMGARLAWEKMVPLFRKAGVRLTLVEVTAAQYRWSGIVSSSSRSSYSKVVLVYETAASTVGFESFLSPKMLDVIRKKLGLPVQARTAVPRRGRRVIRIAHRHASRLYVVAAGKAAMDEGIVVPLFAPTLPVVASCHVKSLPRGGLWFRFDRVRLAAGCSRSGSRQRTGRRLRSK